MGEKNKKMRRLILILLLLISSITLAQTQTFKSLVFIAEVDGNFKVLEERPAYSKVTVYQETQKIGILVDDLYLDLNIVSRLKNIYFAKKVWIRVKTVDPKGVVIIVCVSEDNSSVMITSKGKLILIYN